MGPSIVDLCIQYVGIVLSAYIILLHSINDRYSLSKKTIGGCVAVLIGIVTGSMFNYIPIICIITMLLLFFLAMWRLFRIRTRYTLTLTIVSFGISYVLFSLAVGVFLLLLFLNKTAVADRFERSIDAWIYIVHYVTTFKGGIIVKSFIFAVQCLLLMGMLRVKRIKSELAKLRNVERNDVLIFMTAVILSVKALFTMSVLERNDPIAVLIVCLFLLEILGFISYFWFRKELQTLYRIRLQESELELLEQSLDSKDKLFGTLRADNERFAALIHKDNKLIPSVVMSLRQAAENTLRAEEAACSLDEISAERSEALAEYESHGQRLAETGVMTLDAVLLYLKDRANSFDVEFCAEILADFAVIPDKATERSEFVAILADLCEYAILSTKGVKNGTAKAKIGLDDGHLFVEVSDNGKRFDGKELKRIGKERVTDGSKNKKNEINRKGLIPLYTILRHNGATLSINEFTGNSDITKSLRVTFVTVQGGRE